MTDRPLKVLLADPHLKGGGQVRYVTNLAAGLVDEGHAVTIACKSGSVLVDRARDAGAALADGLTLRGGLRPRAWLHDIRTLRDLLRREPPDVMHVNGSQDHWVCALADRSLGRPVCVVRTRHNTYPVSDGPANRLLNRRWTDYQIVVCDVVRRTLATQHAFDADRMCTIHNGVDARRFAPDDAARRLARDRFGYDETHVVVGIAARLVPAKGHEFLFRAVARLRSARPELRVLVLGEGPLDSDLRRLVRDLGIGDVVTFAGFRDDMPECVQALDIGVQPSIDCDTSSFSLKEQMAAGKPVVASDYGGLTEIVADGVEGLVVPAGTVEPLAETIGRLAVDANLRARMGGAGRERVLREFTVEVFAAKTVDAYRRAIGIHRERTARR